MIRNLFVISILLLGFYLFSDRFIITIPVEKKLFKKFSWEIELPSLQQQPSISFPAIIGNSKCLTTLTSGLLENGRLMITATIEVLEAIDTLDPSQILEISQDPLHNKDDVSTEINGFEVLESQVNQVKEIFEKHPDLTSSISLKNQDLKNAYVNALLDLIKTFSKAYPMELTEEDMKKADDTISDLRQAGFKLDWLLRKWDQALENHIASNTRIKELEKQVKMQKLALAELEGDLEKEKAAASATMMLLD